MVLETNNKKINKVPLTYVSLFSSAGVGCYGFKQAGFECIATNEIIERRLNIQKYNKKCKYNSGYISGDITLQETKQKVFNELKMWKEKENINKLDVLIATPPCQGMSTANYKKGNEINRNSLVVEAIHIIKELEPRVFVFENVRAFLTTMCIDKDEEQLSIESCINKNLSNKYNIFGKVINFMEYGVPSSRPRTIVIGTLKSEMNMSPLNIFPLKSSIVTVRDAIGDLKSLKYGKFDKNDYYHSFRIYPQYMQEWIHDLKEGETAFNNKKNKIPYKLVNGKKQILKSGFMGNKFCRMYWDKPAPCITTRNDQLASQSTIHPKDDRVLSIRELMRVMTIPDEFVWVNDNNRDIINNAETLIRQSIGEAVPTKIMYLIAFNIKEMIEYDNYILSYKRKSIPDKVITKNTYIKSFIYERKLNNTKETGSFYTPQSIVYNTIKELKISDKEIHILEPSVGTGAFIPQILRLVDDCEKVEFDLIDISTEALSKLKEIIKSLKLSSKFKFNYINDDFIKCDFNNKKYNFIISNPPYFKLEAKAKKEYKKYIKVKTDNIFCLFLDKFRYLSDEILCVIPKVFIMIPDCNDVRHAYEREYRVVSLYDYGVKYFDEVFIEIISVHFNKNFDKKKLTHIENINEKISKDVEYDYIYNKKLWILYRDEWFDKYINNLKLDVFDFYRDRQVTNKYLKNDGKIWVVRSKNLLDDGTIVHKQGYDKYIDSLDGFQISKYFNKNNIIFTNFTYNTRATILPKGMIVNGSFCIFETKNNINNIDLSIYSTDEFRKYYAIVKNLSKFTINVDSNSIYYIGVKKDD